MVSVKQLEGDYSFRKQNSDTEQFQLHLIPLKGSKTLLYCLRASVSEGDGASGGFSCNSEGQSVLGTLLLAQWEDCAWKGQFRYDVTSCETKVIFGEQKFIAQLNEKWSSNRLTLFDNTSIQPLDTLEVNGIKIHKEDILLCIANGKTECTELISSAVMPRDGTLVIINVNPIEYGHVYLVPYEFYLQPEILDKRSLEHITQITVEIEDSSFYAFYDYAPSADPGALYFQANFFANGLPVELLQLVPLYDSVLNNGLQICEVAGYPLKTLVFMSKNLTVLTGVLLEICSVLQEHQAVFSMLISDCGRKFFLFPQDQSSCAPHLSAWECGGYSIFTKASEFESTSEEEISKRLASVSLGDKAFQALKQLSVGIASKLAPPLDENTAPTFD